MAFTVSGSIRQPRMITTPPIEIEITGDSLRSIPSEAIGFNYVLCGAGGAGGNGGIVCGGGGGAAGEFVAGTILVRELLEVLGVARSQILILATIGESTAIGEQGGESRLSIAGSVLAIAQGGYGGLAGTQYQGWSPWDGGATYTSNGGRGQMAQRNEARSRGEPNPSIVRLNQCGDGGNGGAIGMAGSLGRSGYFSIQFF